MSLVQTTVDDAVATITIAPAGGRYDRALLDRLTTAAEAVAADSAVRAVVLRAEADFGAGWAPDVEAAEAAAAAAAVEAVARLPQPSVAALRGAVISAGLELALACDIRVAAPDARFALPDTLAGTVPRAGGTQRLPRAVGRAQALRLILTGEEVDAGEALRIGLVSAVVPSPDGAAGDAAGVDGLARRVAESIAARAPLATRLAKEAVHRGAELTLEQALRYELDLTVLLQSTADRAEGVRAFAEKRPPRFIGR